VPPTPAAGIVLFRRTQDDFEVLIAHMGGPFWSRKDERGWTIPKGAIEPGETTEQAARREFEEELGSPVPDAPLLALGGFPQPRKHITAFAVEGDLDADAIVSNEFEMEWPRGSGRMQSYPELDRAMWADLELARVKLVKGQVPIIEALRDHLVEQRLIAP
jgi:predicted NUDIX family NTP pyrophosphohydrolase